MPPFTSVAAHDQLMTSSSRPHRSSKRQRHEQDAESPGRSSKKSKTCHQLPSPAGMTLIKDKACTAQSDKGLYPHLSKWWLTHRALEELDRRNRKQLRKTSSLAGPKQINPSSNFQAQQEKINQFAQLEGSDLRDERDKIKRFARFGGPDLDDIRGCPEPGRTNEPKRGMDPGQQSSRSKSQSRPSSAPNHSTPEITTKRSSAYDKNFEQNLLDHGIYPDAYHFSVKPTNLGDIRKRLEQRRPSLSPSQFPTESFEKFSDASVNATSEAQVMGTVFRTIVGKADDDIPSGENLLFNNLNLLTNGSIVNAKPDFYNGAHPNQLESCIREELTNDIVPSRQSGAPILPNFFVEVKGQNGSLAVARRQACYNGALGARAMERLRTHNRSPGIPLENVARTITSTYRSGFLNIYTCHLTQVPDSDAQIQYNMTQVGAWALNGSRDQFCDGAGALRNARNWAKEQRSVVIANANSGFQQNHSGGIAHESTKPIADQLRGRRGRRDRSVEDRRRSSGISGSSSSSSISKCKPKKETMARSKLSQDS